MTVLNIERLPVRVRKPLMWYCNCMGNLHGDNLISMVLYGSAVDQDFNPKRSNINIVLVFKAITAETLHKSLRLIRKGRRHKIVAPLFFTLEHIHSSCDTFPMEFIEIKEKHHLLYGDDIFTDITIDNRNLRLQCEQQIKSMLIKLRQSYLEVGLARQGIEHLILDSFRSLLPIMRTVLRLKGEVIPQDKETLIRQASSLASLATPVFIMVLKDKAGDEKIGGKQVVEFFNEYLYELTKLAYFIDKL